MATSHGAQAVIGLSGFESLPGGVRVHRERVARIELPEQFDGDQLALMRQDLAVIADIADQYPTELLALNNAVLGRDYATVNRLAGQIGLTEENLVARGGGQWGVVVVIAVAAALLLASDSPPPPAPPPPPPDPVVVPPDAGPG